MRDEPKTGNQRVVELEAEIKQIHKAARQTTQRGDVLLEDNTRLRAKIKQLGEHRDGCSFIDYGHNDYRVYCTCGIDLEAEIKRLRGFLEKRFPIQDGQSVPWWVMLPHEAQCKTNHGQTLERIAQRGGFGAGEAWCVVNDLHWKEADKMGWDKADKLWAEFAEKVNRLDP